MVVSQLLAVRYNLLCICLCSLTLSDPFTFLPIASLVARYNLFSICLYSLVLPNPIPFLPLAQLAHRYNMCMLLGPPYSKSFPATR